MVAHCDIDAFYASVELLKRPDLRGRPLIVAGTGPRSVVTTASYEARRFGVDSAMPASRARALCPQAVVLAPDFEGYRAKSREVWALVGGRVPLVQQVGIDEAYLDVTECEKPLRLLRALVVQIRADTGLTMSVGVGPSRLVAKTVSSTFKPAAFAALSREDACARFRDSPTRILQGIGPKTAERLAAMGIDTVGDLQRQDETMLSPVVGERMARDLRARAWFCDDSPVTPVGPAKSRSAETTFPEDVADHAQLEETLRELAHKLCDQMQRRDVAGRSIGIKVRLGDWTTVTRARSVDWPTNDPDVVIPVVVELFRAYAPRLPVRLLGVRVAGFDPPRPADASVAQLTLPL